MSEGERERGGNARRAPGDHVPPRVYIRWVNLPSDRKTEKRTDVQMGRMERQKDRRQQHTERRKGRQKDREADRQHGRGSEEGNSKNWRLPMKKRKKEGDIAN